MFLFEDIRLDLMSLRCVLYVKVCGIDSAVDLIETPLQIFDEFMQATLKDLGHGVVAQLDTHLTQDLSGSLMMIARVVPEIIRKALSVRYRQYSVDQGKQLSSITPSTGST